MRRTSTLTPLLVVAMALLGAASVVARAPVALGVATQSSTDLAAVDYWSSIGAKPALWTLWSTWGDRAGSPTCVKDIGTCAFPTAVALGLRARDITPVVWWQPTDPTNPSAGTYGRYQNIIEGQHDEYIRSWAKTAKRLGKPVIVRMFHEMNGDWFEWSLDNFDNDPTRFKQAWRHIVREFRRVGANNVRFLWTPYTWGKGRYEVAYPGNRYVDYVGVTSLNWGETRWKPLEGLLERPMGALRKVTESAREPRGKPVILPEVGSNYLGGDKAAWISDGYHGATKRWAAIRALVYFDYDTTPAGQPDWRLAQPSDGSALAAYQSVAAHKVFRASLP